MVHVRLLREGEVVAYDQGGAALGFGVILDFRGFTFLVNRSLILQMDLDILIYPGCLQRTLI